MAVREKHRSECAYAGLPYKQRGQLPWPAGEGDMCVCDYIDRRDADAARPPTLVWEGDDG